MARILAIDHGDKKIGLAIGDTEEYVIAPYEVISTGSFEDTFTKLGDVINENRVDEIVIGYPLNLQGKKTDQTRAVEEFAEILGKKVDLPITLEDERLTSVQAARQTRGFFKRLWEGKAKDNIQKTSAVLILETYLEKKKKEKP